MAWLVAWLVFGLLAAFEAGAIAMHASSEWGAMLALVCLGVSIAALCVLAVRAMRHGRPAGLRWPLLISIVALAGCLWALYGDDDSTSWVTTAMFGTAYSGACLIASGVAMVFAWRRNRAHEARMAQIRAERERNRRMDSIRPEASARGAGAAARGDGEHDLGADGDFVLPSRPKWEDS